MENQSNFKSVLDLSRRDVCFIESGDRQVAGIIEVSNTQISKSGKFITIWYYQIEKSDRGQLGVIASQYKHPQKGYLYYISKSIKAEVEMIGRAEA